MNSLTIAQPTMSSREIADLVESRHDNVKRSMETMRNLGVISFTQSEEKTNGRPAILYHVNKRDSYVVVAQLSPEFTARLVDRWQELEQQAAQPPAPALPQTYLEALEHLVIAERGRIEAEGEVKRLQQVCQIMTNQFSDGMTPPVFCRQLNGVNTMKVQGKLAELGLIRATKYGYRAMPHTRDRLFAEIHETKGVRPVEMVTLTMKGAKRLYKMYLDGDLTMKGDWDGQYSHVKFESNDVAVIQ